MPHPDGAHTHGPSGPDLNWIAVAIIVVLAMAGGTEAATSVIDGLAALLMWLAVVLGIAVVVTAAIVAVALKRRTPDYVRMVHGVTERDRLIGERAQIQRDAAQFRAMRREIETRVLTQQAWEKLTAAEFPQGTVVRADYTLNDTESGPRG